MGLQAQVGWEVILAFLGYWTTQDHQAKCGLQFRFPTPPSHPPNLHQELFRPALLLWSSVGTAARPANLEAERPLPPNQRNRLKMLCHSPEAKMGLAGSGFTNQKAERSKVSGGSPEWQPCLLRAFSRAPFCAAHKHTASVPSGSHPLPCPRACDPWAGRRCFGLLDSLGQHFLSQAGPPSMVFLVSSTRHTCSDPLPFSITTAISYLANSQS